MATQADVRRIALSLPASEQIPGRFAFAVRSKGKLKSFAWVWMERIAPNKPRVPEPRVIAVRTASIEDRERMLTLDATKFFTEPHYAGFPAILVRLPALTVRELEPIITEGWRCQAPRDLTVKQTPPMAPMIPNPKKIKSFRTQKAFDAWLSANHARETEIWLKVHKKDSGLASVTCAEALDVALCWGWIDGIRKAFDERSFLQRYTPRQARSIWSQINRDNVARLTAAGRMTPHGKRQIDAAKADGRWAAAYAPMRNASVAAVPDDLRAAIEANPRARKTFRTLGRRNLFSLAFRTNNMKTPDGRARKIAALVEMLARGETIVPEAPR